MPSKQSCTAVWHEPVDNRQPQLPQSEQGALNLMEITPEQYETLQTIFPDHAIDAFSGELGVTITIWANEDDEH